MQRFGLACGVIAPVWWAFMIVYCASPFPGYSHVTDFISELAAKRSPTEMLMRDAGFVATGGLYLAFAAELAWQFRHDRLAWVAALLLALNGMARIGAGLNQCEPGCASDVISLDQDWHYRFASTGYWLTMCAAIVWGFVGNRDTRLRHLLALGIGTATWCAVSLVMMELHAEWQGLFQRLASGILSVWVVVLAVSAWRTLSTPVTFSEDLSHVSRRTRKSS